MYLFQELFDSDSDSTLYIVYIHRLQKLENGLD